MGKQKFYEALCQELLIKLGEKYVVERSLVINGNVTLDGLLIRENEATGRAMVSSIYLNPYRQRFYEGESIEVIVEDILRLYKKNCDSGENQKVDELYDFDIAKKKIVMRFINLEQNRGLLENLPHIQMKKTKRACVFYAILQKDVHGTIGCYITKQMLALWQIDMEELQANVKENMKNYYYLK